MKRRDFLKAAGGAAAGVAASGYAVRNLAALIQGSDAKQDWIPGAANWIPSVCQQCPSGCGILVKVVEGNAKSIRGNPSYPVNRSGLCPKGLAGLQALYHPDRIRRPLRRKGNRGEGKWEEISWETALASVLKPLQELREKEEAHRLAIFDGNYRGLQSALWERFARTFGTPNYFHVLPTDVQYESRVQYLTQGIETPFTFDWENTRYVLSFGSNLLEEGTSLVHFLKAYGDLREPTEGQRFRLIQIEPRLSITAAKADQWIPINPGTEGALALALAQIIIKGDLYDHDFVDNHAFGFEDWRDAQGTTHMGFKTLVLSEYDNIEDVSRLTGVPVATIIRLGKEFGESRPAVAVGRGSSTNSLYSLLAVHALNALVGSIDSPGGVIVPDQVPTRPLPEFEPDEQARKSLMQPRLDDIPGRYPLAKYSVPALIENLQASRPYKAGAMFFAGVNAVFFSPSGRELGGALSKVPLLVSFSPFLDEATSWCDLVLPNHTYLERWQDDPINHGIGYPVYGLRQPAVQPLYDTRHTSDVVLSLAQGLGADVKGAFPWSDFREILRQSVQGLFDAQRGNLIEATSEETWTRLLAERGWRTPSYRTADELWNQLLESGGWWDPAYRFGEWERVLRTPSGKFEFFVQSLNDRMGEMARKGSSRTEIIRNLNLVGVGDLVFLPHYEPAHFEGGELDYPFTLYLSRHLPVSEDFHADLPFLPEIMAPEVNMRWKSWVEVNPETAHKLGIRDRDLVWVESPSGKLKMQAKLYPGIMPDVVSIPLGLGHKAFGHWAKGLGVNPLEIERAQTEPLAGLETWTQTRVKVYRA